MSRDLTPAELLTLEQYNIQKHGASSLLDFMKGTIVTYNGISKPMYSEENIAIREQYPMLGKLYSPFDKLYKALSGIEGGLDLLKKKDEELSSFVSFGEGDRDSYLIQWFQGTLDKGFYYSEYNDELFFDSITEEARFRSRASLDSRIQSAKARAGESRNDKSEVSHPMCKVTFVCTAGEREDHRFDVFLDMTPKDYSKEKDVFLLDVDERLAAYDAAEEVVGEKGISNYVILSAEMVDSPNHQPPEKTNQHER